MFGVSLPVAAVLSPVFSLEFQKAAMDPDISTMNNQKYAFYMANKATAGCFLFAA